MPETEVRSSRLHDGALTYLCARGREVAFSDGEAVIRRGQKGEAFYVVLEGELDVVLSAEDGGRLAVARLKEGASFGEMSLLSQEAVSADVVARGPARVLIFPGHLFKAALAECEGLRDLVLAGLVRNLRRTTQNVWNSAQSSQVMQLLVSTLAPGGEVIAKSGPMLQAQKRLAELAAKPGPMLLTGEAGTGKLAAAKRIHELACGGQAPFIVVDCQRLGGAEDAAIIFGSEAHDEFAATARGDNDEKLHALGTLHLADAGTLVLRNIDSMNLPAQRILCRYLEMQAGNVPGLPQARVIATTREDLAALAKSGGFSPGLAAAFGPRTLRVPALRDRKRDIVPLAKLFLQEHQHRTGGVPQELTASAQQALVSVQYRGRNVSELRDAVELAAAIAGGREIRGEHVFAGAKDQQKVIEYDLGQIPWVGALIRGRALDIARTGVLAIFAVMIVCCLLGAYTAHAGRMANALTWSLWWPALMLVSLIGGRLWCSLCPISLVGRLGGRVKKFALPPPAWLRQYSGWIAALLYVLIIWNELVFRMPEHPWATGWLFVSLMAGALVVGVLYERESWCRYVCPLGSLAACYSAAGTVHVRANPNICAAQCTTHDCVKGNANNPPCPVFHHPLYAREGFLCKLCMRCVRNCPNGSARLYLRPPLWSVWGINELSDSLLPFALVGFFLSIVMLGAGTFEWAARPAAFTGLALLAIVGAIGLRRLLPLLLAHHHDPDPALLGRVGFALMVLGWGPFMAFHLGHIPGLEALRILPTNAGAAARGFGLLTALQILLIALAALLAGITLWRIRLLGLGGNRPAVTWGWRMLLGICAAYTLLATIVILHQEIRF